MGGTAVLADPFLPAERWVKEKEREGGREERLGGRRGREEREKE